MNKILVMQEIDQLNTVSTIIEQLKVKMNTLASNTSGISGRHVVPSLRSQIMAKSVISHDFLIIAL